MDAATTTLKCPQCGFVVTQKVLREHSKAEYRCRVRLGIHDHDTHLECVVLSVTLKLEIPDPDGTLATALRSFSELHFRVQAIRKRGETPRAEYAARAKALETTIKAHLEPHLGDAWKEVVIFEWNTDDFITPQEAAGLMAPAG